MLYRTWVMGGQPKLHYVTLLQRRFLPRGTPPLPYPDSERAEVVGVGLSAVVEGGLHQGGEDPVAARPVYGAVHREHLVRLLRPQRLHGRALVLLVGEQVHVPAALEEEAGLGEHARLPEERTAQGEEPPHQRRLLEERVHGVRREPPPAGGAAPAAAGERGTSAHCSALSSHARRGASPACRGSWQIGVATSPKPQGWVAIVSKRSNGCSGAQPRGHSPLAPVAPE
mmetsp:Transcript_5330/g.17742  ORF Transcript_5330/g.17742 Transcript_5330/m.17742 type:complete len:227 (-) Transcript_5330:1577-2257(-)